MKRLLALLLLPSRYHFLGSLLIVMVVSSAIATQMTDRRNFASSELYSDVMDRWGAPIVQPGPSVRYVPSGAVFNSLAALPLQSQEVTVDAAMNYRKRGLVYFSGFDLSWRLQCRERSGARHRHRVCLSDQYGEEQSPLIELGVHRSWRAQEGRARQRIGSASCGRGG